MKIKLLVFLLLTSLLGAAQLPGKTIDSILNLYYGKGEFNGVAFISIKNKPEYHKSFGYKNVNKKEKFTGEEIFQIGSVTKQFTAAVILKLQEEGKLSVNDKLTKYFPQYPAWDSITIHHLLNHTSGLFNYTNISKFMQEEVASSKTREELIKLFSHRSLQFSPGTKYAYSNSGYLLLGYIIEDITGLSYDKAVRKYIFESIGMNNSGFDFTNLSSNLKTTGYSLIKGDSAIVSPVVDSTVSGAAGNIFSNVKDLNNWIQSLCKEKIINKESLEKMFSPGLGNYGYGIVSDSIYGKHRVSHGGGIHGFNSNLEYFPGTETSIVLLSNVNTGKLQEISNMLSAIAHNLPLPEEYQPDINTLKKLEGKYKVSENFAIDIRIADGVLTLQATNQGRFPLTAITDTNFVLKIVNATINFSQNQKGEINKLELIQNGMNITGIKEEGQSLLKNEN